MPVFGVDQLGQSEIDEFCVVRFRYQYIFWLDVTMQDAGLMSAGQCVGDSNGELDDATNGRLLALCPFTKCEAVDEFGNQVVPAFEFSRVVYRQDMWMVER